MDEFLELEKRCKKLKFKRILKYFILIILLFVLVFGLYLFFKTQQISKNTDKTIKKENKIKTHQTTKLLIKESNKTKEIKKQKIISKKEINKTKKEIKPINIPKWNIEFNLDDINISTKKPKKTKSIKKSKEVQVFKTETITFDKAIKLAKFYYNNDDYESSIKWCKIASNIDNENEEIWKLYALNLEKLNQKQKAIKVLKTYLKYKDSPELRFILQRLEK